jgi:translation initiation factor IF-1
MLEAGEIGADQIEVHQLRLVRLERGDRLAVRTEDAELERGRLTGR